MRFILIFILLFTILSLFAIYEDKYSIFYEDDMVYITEGRIIRIDTITYSDSNFVKLYQTYYFDEYTWTDTLIFFKFDIDEFKNNLRDKMKENRKSFELQYRKEINKLYKKLK